MVAKLKLTDERDYFKPFNYPWAYEAWLKHEQSHCMVIGNLDVEEIINYNTFQNLEAELKFRTWRKC